jgi:hypothetical protein
MSSPQTYRLTGNVGDMNKLVNRRVEVTGVVEGQSGSQPGTGAASGTVGSSAGGSGSQTAGGTASGAGSTGSAARTTSGSTSGDRSATGTQRTSGDAPRLRVTSIREVSGGPSCTPAGLP